MKRLVVLTAAVVASVCLNTTASAVAAPSSAGHGSVVEALSTQLAQKPTGRVVGNRIYYPDGEVFVAVEAGTFSLSQCGSGEFCIWSYPSYSGSFTYKTGSGVTRTISTSVGSFYNNRSTGARLYTNTGAGSTCYAAQAQRATVSASYNSAEKVYLSSTASC